MTKPRCPARDAERRVILKDGATKTYATTAGKRVTSPENAAAKEAKEAKGAKETKAAKAAKATRVVKEEKVKRAAKEAKETTASETTKP